MKQFRPTTPKAPQGIILLFRSPCGSREGLTKLKLSHPLGHPLPAHLPPRCPARRAGLKGTPGNPRWVLEGIQGLVKVPVKSGLFLNGRAHSFLAEFHRVVPGTRRAPLLCPVFEIPPALSPRTQQQPGVLPDPAVVPCSGGSAEPRSGWLIPEMAPSTLPVWLGLREQRRVPEHAACLPGT